MNCVILQPSYIPWRGYFHQVQRADVFVFYDDVQYDKHGWRNRNRVKTSNGPTWLTIPVQAKGAVSGGLPISDVRVQPGGKWLRQHRRTLEQSYRKAPFYDRYAPLLDEFYSSAPELLAPYVMSWTERLARELGLDTRFVRSSELGIEGERSERLANIVQQVGASHYVSGPSARDYLDTSQFERRGLTVEWMEYDYPPYEQLHGAFEPQLSVLDLLLMHGPDAPRYIWDCR